MKEGWCLDVEFFGFYELLSVYFQAKLGPSIDIPCLFS
jgi:hypothetical protein